MTDQLPSSVLPLDVSSPYCPTALPALVVSSGDHAPERFIEFFTAQIRNPNTRRAYYRAVSDFLLWGETQRFANLAAIRPVHVAAYIELLQRKHSVPTVKQSLAALRMLFDWLVVGQVIPLNPAMSVRGPSYSIKRGKTPVLSPDDAREFLDSIALDNVVGLRDRALIGLMIYSFARIGAALAMRVEDYYPNGKRWWVRLHEKGGKHHEMPVHHTLEEYLDAYLTAADIRQDKKGWLFRTAAGKTGRLTERLMLQTYAWRMIRRRAQQAGIATPIGNHTFRGTGITAYLDNGGTLEKAQQMAAHESPRTTKLYDRTQDTVTLDEVERILI